MNRYVSILIWSAVAVVGGFAFAAIALKRGEAVSAVWLVTAALAVYFLAYRYYSMYIAARVLENQAEAISPTAKVFTSDMIGSALATRGLMEHLRSFGEITSGPRPFSPKDRSLFLSALDAALIRAKKKSA